jgi:hypothetical protein
LTCGDSDGGVGSCGNVFELTPEATGTWKESALFNFSDNTTGFNPSTNLVIDQEGTCMGRGQRWTDFGGIGFQTNPESHGKVTESIVHNFGGPCCADGVHPFNGLTIDDAENLYGAVQGGGGTTTVCIGGFVDTRLRHCLQADAPCQWQLLDGDDSVCLPRFE